MELDQLFCWTMADLDACIVSTWHYHQMRIAGLLRLLTFDESPLVYQVNREHRLKLSFHYYEEVTAEHPDSSNDLSVGDFAFSVAALDPRPLVDAGGMPTSVSLEKLLQVGVLRLNGRLLTIREYVRQMGYIEGLIHAGKAKDDFESSLLVVRTGLRRLDNLSLLGYDLLRQIGRVVHMGLTPLRNAVQTKRLAKDGLYPSFNYG